MGDVNQFLDDGTEPCPYVPPHLARVGILPVPLEKTVSYLSGTAQAPGQIIQASRQIELYDPELEASPYEIGIHTYPPVDCSKGMEDILDIIGRQITSISSSGQTPVCLGGEHTLTLAPIRVLSKVYEELSVLHLDAHADLRESYSGIRLSHACVMRRIYELGLPSISVGVRSLSEEEAEFISEKKLTVYPGWTWRERQYPGEEIAERLSGKVYITVDMDVFDPSEVPGVGTPEPGGLRWGEALGLFRSLRDSGRKVVGFDLVELSPKAKSVVSSFFAARLLYKMIGYFCRE